MAGEGAAALQVFWDLQSVWNENDVEAVLAMLHPDFEYQTNQDTDNGPLRANKSEMRSLLEPFAQLTTHSSTPLMVAYRDDAIRARLDLTVKHNVSGKQLKTTFRQTLTIRDGLILRWEEFHDMALMRAFWADAEGQRPRPEPEFMDKLTPTEQIVTLLFKNLNEKS